MDLNSTGYGTNQSESIDYGTTQSNSTGPVVLTEDDYIIVIAGLVIFILIIVCIISVCIRAYKKTKKLLKKQRKALLKKDHVSLALLGNQNPYNSPYPVNHVGFIDPNAYPFIPPQSNFAYPSAYSYLPK